jgi:hypothetical protein
MTFAIAALVLVALVETGVLWWVGRGLRRLDHVEARLGRLTEAVSLLAETTESGFRANAVELGRLGESPAASRQTSRAKTSRVSRSARRGRSVSDIAAGEEMSEGEVRLRLHLADTTPSARVPAGREARRGAVRA